MQNSELYNAVETGNVINKEITDILLELDGTGSSTTQAELNKLLVTLYKRIGNGESVSIEILSGSEPTTQAQLTEWIDAEIDPYSQGLFHKAIKG